MARYIDEDEFVAWVKKCYCSDCNNDNGLRCRVCWIDDAIDLVEEAPPADVVPRSEVAREIFEEIEREINDALQSNYKVLPIIEQSEALWNRVSGKIDALRGIDGFIAELKEKHTEENNDGQ